MSETPAVSPYLFTAPRDVIFHVIYGVNMHMILDMLYDSALRISEYTGRCTAMKVFECARTSLLNARAVFILFLSVDSNLRERVACGDIEGSGAESGTDDKCHMVFQALCPFKSERLFLGLQQEVIEPWIRHNCNTPSDLVDSFENEYLCS